MKTNKSHEKIYSPSVKDCTNTDTLGEHTGCPTRYRTRHFFNNSNTNENIATKFEHEYVRSVRNEEECVCSATNFCDTV